jgi:ABC-2 type transport system ATP-binding protein
VDGMNLDIMPGDCYGFIGHNGAGKTTTLRAAVGVLDFDEGEIAVCGHDVRREPIECKSLLAYIPDNPDIYQFMTGVQYLNFIADIFTLRDREAKIEQYSKMFELDTRLSELVGEYSHGMRQKLAIISALIHEPKLLVLDEPFVGLDPIASHTLRGCMAAICEGGGAVFFSTHVLEVAQKLCNKIAIIRRGVLVSSGDTAEVCGNRDLEQVFLELEREGDGEGDA